MLYGIDIKENDLLAMGGGILNALLLDRTTGENIIWATDDYASMGEAYTFHQHITVDLITGDNQNVIQPRVAKSEDERKLRARKMAEVFTPSWVCNKMNNGVDEAWFKRKPVFNIPIDEGKHHGWQPTEGKVTFPEGKTWQEYVKMGVIEITCGEAPFLASRYDTADNNKMNMKYSDWLNTGNSVFYQGESVLLDGIYDMEFDNFATAEEMDEYPHLCIAHIYAEDNRSDLVPITKLQPLRHLNELSEDELKQLRKETYFGGFFYSAYVNSYGVDKHEFANVADSYLYALENGMGFPEEGDTPENFAYYCLNMN